MFDPCVNRTLELIDGQVAEIHKKGARVKVSHSILGSGKEEDINVSCDQAVFLVGGFGKSNYMFKKVEEYCSQRGFTAMRPDNP
jgi:hypothetical protein